MVNNKYERRLKAKVKQKRRARIVTAGWKTMTIPIKWFHKLRSMSTVCSCSLCSPSKYLEKGEVKEKQKLFNEELKFHEERFDDDDIDILSEVI